MFQSPPPRIIIFINEVEKKLNKKVLFQFTYNVFSIDYGSDTELDCPQIFEFMLW